MSLSWFFCASAAGRGCPSRPGSTRAELRRPCSRSLHPPRPPPPPAPPPPVASPRVALLAPSPRPPLLGWSSWSHYHRDVRESDIEAQADVVAATLLPSGY